MAVSAVGRMIVPGNRIESELLVDRRYDRRQRVDVAKGQTFGALFHVLTGIIFQVVLMFARNLRATDDEVSLV